jgi:Putative prokaryotic signal transducing protein
MLDSSLKVVKTYVSTLDAELDKGRLESAGIQAMIQADDCGGMRPHLQLQGVTLMVRAEDEADAVEILSQEDEPQP